MTNKEEARFKSREEQTDADPLHFVREALGKLRFGGVQLTVHEGKLIQVEVTEKHRFT